MIHVILYLVSSYLLVAIVIGMTNVLLKQQYISHGRFFTSYIKYLFLAILLILPIVPYTWVEVQTLIFKPVVIESALKTTREIGTPNERILTLKVLSMSKYRARVYIISRGWLAPNTVFCESNKPCACSRGDIVNLFITSEGWKFEGDYSTIWSDCGSADGNIFPPYFSKGDYND